MPPGTETPGQFSASDYISIRSATNKSYITSISWPYVLVVFKSGPTGFYTVLYPVGSAFETQLQSAGLEKSMRKVILVFFRFISVGNKQAVPRIAFSIHDDVVVLIGSAFGIIGTLASAHLQLSHYVPTTARTFVCSNGYLDRCSPALSSTLRQR